MRYHRGLCAATVLWMSWGISLQEEDEEYVNLPASREAQITNVYFANWAD